MYASLLTEVVSVWVAIHINHSRLAAYQVIPEQTFSAENPTEGRIILPLARLFWYVLRRAAPWPTKMDRSKTLGHLAMWQALQPTPASVAPRRIGSNRPARPTARSLNNHVRAAPTPVDQAQNTTRGPQYLPARRHLSRRCRQQHRQRRSKVAAQVRKDYGISAAKAMLPGSKTAYTMSHSSFLYLIDKHGSLRSMMPFGNSADDVAHDIRILLNSPKK